MDEFQTTFVTFKAFLDLVGPMQIDDASRAQVAATLAQAHQTRKLVELVSQIQTSTLTTIAAKTAEQADSLAALASCVKDKTIAATVA